MRMMDENTIIQQGARYTYIELYTTGQYYYCCWRSEGLERWARIILLTSII